MTFWFKLFCLPPPRHRAHLECLVELVSLELLERRSAFPISNYTASACAHTVDWWWFMCVGLCASVCVVCFYLSECSLSTRVRTEKLETLGQLESLALV